MTPLLLLCHISSEPIYVKHSFKTNRKKITSNEKTERFGFFQLEEKIVWKGVSRLI